jgi:transcription initiation factor TFIIE subunit alpha
LAGSGAKEEGAESGRNGAELKVLPPWMVKEGMNLTKEQRGETSNTSSNGDEKSEGKDAKKQDPKEDEKSIQVSQLSIENRTVFAIKRVLTLIIF